MDHRAHAGGGSGLGHSADGRDHRSPTAVVKPGRGVAPPCRRGSFRARTVDEHEQPASERQQRRERVVRRGRDGLAVAEVLEDERADAPQPAVGQYVPTRGQEPGRAELHPLDAGGRDPVEHLARRRVEGVVREVNAPRHGRARQDDAAHLARASASTAARSASSAASSERSMSVVGVRGADVAAPEALGHLEHAARDQLAPVAAEQRRRRCAARPRRSPAGPSMKHRTNSEPKPPTTAGTPARCGDLRQPAPHPLAEREDVLVHAAVLELLDRRQAGLDGDRVAVVGAAEVDVAVRRRVEALHVLAPPADRGEREAVGDRLAHRRQVGHDAADRLVAADVVPEAGDHLVEDQQRARTRRTARAGPRGSRAREQARASCARPARR